MDNNTLKYIFIGLTTLVVACLGYVLYKLNDVSNNNKNIIKAVSSSNKEILNTVRTQYGNVCGEFINLHEKINNGSRVPAPYYKYSQPSLQRPGPYDTIPDNFEPEQKYSSNYHEQYNQNNQTEIDNLDADTISVAGSDIDTDAEATAGLDDMRMEFKTKL